VSTIDEEMGDRTYDGCVIIWTTVCTAMLPSSAATVLCDLLSCMFTTDPRCSSPDGPNLKLSHIVGDDALPSPSSKLSAVDSLSQPLMHWVCFCKDAVMFTLV